MTPALSAPAATVQFGLDMMAELRGSGNLVFSPDSIAAAVAMAGVGATGDTAAQMAATLALPDPAAFTSLGALQRQLESDQATAAAGDPDAPIFQMAGGLFVQPGLALQDGFASVLGTQFGATPEKVDFTTRQAQDAINAFVSRHTAGVIGQALQGPLDPATVLALVDTLYFKGRWASPFDLAASAPARPRRCRTCARPTTASSTCRTDRRRSH